MSKKQDNGDSNGKRDRQIQNAGAIAGIGSLVLSAVTAKLPVPDGWSAVMPTAAIVLAAVGAALLIGFLIAKIWVRVGHSRALRRSMCMYFGSVIDELMAELPALPSSLDPAGYADRLRERSCYVDPPYSWVAISKYPHEYNESQATASSLSVHIRETLNEGSSVILVGEPGTGKSLAAYLCFAELADRRRTSRREPFPVLIRLNSLRLDQVPRESAALWKLMPVELTTMFDERDLRRISSDRFVFILDGLDELPSSRGGRNEAFVLPKEIEEFTKHPCLLTCRTQFHQLYVDAHPIYHDFHREAGILKLEFDQHVRRYVETYCMSRDIDEATGQAIEGTIRDNHALREVCGRALMLRMTVSVVNARLAASNENIVRRYVFTGSDSINAQIYEEYITRWIRRDHAKEVRVSNGTELLWTEKVSLVESVAYAIFSGSLSAERPFSSFELADLLITSEELRAVASTWLCEKHLETTRSLESVLLELEERTFLIVNHRRRDYRFVHKSFYEYLLARYVVATLSRPSCSSDLVFKVLKTPLPDEVIDFVRELLHWVAEGTNDEFRQDWIIRSLGTVRESIVVGPDNLSQPNLMALQQAANLVPVVASDAVMVELKALFDADIHPFLRRGIAVGIALHHDDESYLDKFVDEMDDNSTARSFHMGYNRIYYGDQGFREGSFEDDGAPECEHFFRACVRHIKDVRYMRLRYMALASLQYFLADSNRANYLASQFRSVLNEAEDEVTATLSVEDLRIRERAERVLVLLKSVPAQSPLSGP